jgi:hypothetical protein
VTYTFVPHPKEETQTVGVTYTITPIQQSGDGYPALRSLAPFGLSPSDKIGYAGSSADSVPDVGAVDGAFVTTGNNRTTYGQDTRALEYFSGSYQYPDKRAAGYYIQYVVYTSESGSVRRYVAPDRAISIDSTRFVDRSGTYTVSMATVDGTDKYVGTNASYIELSWVCEVLTFYDADGNVVSETGAWVTYTVDYTITTQNVPQYGYVMMKSQIMNGVAARQGRAFSVTETETEVVL